MNQEREYLVGGGKDEKLMREAVRRSNEAEAGYRDLGQAQMGTKTVEEYEIAYARTLGAFRCWQQERSMALDLIAIWAGVGLR